MSEGHVLGKKARSPLKLFVYRGNAYSPKASLGQMTAEAQLPTPAPVTEALPKRGGVCWHTIVLLFPLSE